MIAIAKTTCNALVYTEAAATETTILAFKRDLITAYSKLRYGADNVEMVYCMMSHAYLPKQFVIGAHLWKRQWAM